MKKKTVSAAEQNGKMSEYVEKKHRHTFLRLVAYFRFFPLLTGITILLALIVNFAAVAKPYIIKVVIDDNMEKGIFDTKVFLFYALLYLLIVTAGAFSEYGQSMLMSSLGQRIMHRLRTDLFSHIQHFNMGFFDRNSSGSILVRVSNDVESLSDLFSTVLISFVKDFLLIISIMATMIALNIKLALFSFLIIPVITVLAFTYRSIGRKNFIRLKATLSRLNAFLAENIIGMRIVQMFGREKRKADDFDVLGKEYYRLGIIEIVLNSLSNPLMNAIANIAIAVVIAFFTRDVMAGAISIGIIYSFTNYIKQFCQPISHLAEQFTTIQSALISADRIFDLIDNKEDIEDMAAGRPVKSFAGKIEFKNVWFAYIGEDWVLKDVSFTIEPGQKVAFVGATGSGKSTIISLLARFYTIQKGQILMDGVDIGEYNLTDLRRQIAVVMQDVFLFSGDISYNIRLNNEDITDEDVEQAARYVSADGFISQLPDGYHNAVAERGSAFSTGQRQLIAFARAVAFAPSILVLDEATANIDTETEIALKGALEKVSEGRTSIVIAHRIATIMDSDCIFVLRHGRIRETGTHEQLVEKSGIYAKLYELSLHSHEEVSRGA